MGMVGGGPDALIGKVHRIAATMDHGVELVAGSFSRDYEKTRIMGNELSLDPDRCYKSYEEMAEKEAKIPADRRMDFVTVVTPNNSHYPVSRCFLEAGFHVVCDKPMTISVEEAEELVELVEKSGLVYCVTYNYTGYPLVRHARSLVKEGTLGNLRKIMVEYLAGGLGEAVEKQGNKQAAWRTDPRQAGQGGTLGDIGTHAFNLVEYITGDTVAELCVDKTSFVEGRVLDDDANALMRMSGGGKGSLSVSQVATGEENALAIRLYGSEGSIRWQQESPMSLDLYLKGQPRQVLTPGHPYLCESAREATRVPPGLPEAYLEAFANIYRGVEEAIRAHAEGSLMSTSDYSFPTVYDGLRGMRFVESAVASAQRASIWVKI